MRQSPPLRASIGPFGQGLRYGPAAWSPRRFSTNLARSGRAASTRFPPLWTTCGRTARSPPILSGGIRIRTIPDRGGHRPDPRAPMTARVSRGNSARTVACASRSAERFRGVSATSEHDPGDPRVVALLLVGRAERRVDGAEPADRLDRRPSVVGDRNRVPGTSVTRDGKGHLGPPGDRSAQAAVERVDEPQLDAISNRLALRIGGDPKPKPEGRGERGQVFETRRSRPRCAPAVRRTTSRSLRHPRRPAA